MQADYGRVAVIGLGYIGLPTAAVLASRGVDVTGVDVNRVAVETINRGDIHIVEPELDVLVRGAVAAKKLRAVGKPEPADAFLIAVPTPFTDGHKPDLSFIQAAARSISPVLKTGDLVVLESTSPVGTTQQLSAWLAGMRPDLVFPDHEDSDRHDVYLAYCPERVLPGKVVRELVENDRIIGGLTPSCTAKAVELYRIFVQGRCIETNARTAEMCKLTENAFRDVNIAFANELSLICDQLGINVWNLIDLANRHPRVNILKPGPGVGGHCIAVDPWFIVDAVPERARLIRTAREVNDRKPAYVVERIREAVAACKNPPTLACLGLSFKADIDDLRESPAVHIVETLARKGIGRILAVEPHIEKIPDHLRQLGVELTTLDRALAQADVIVGLVDHRVFQSIDKSLLSRKQIVDTRGMWR